MVHRGLAICGYRGPLNGSVEPQPDPRWRGGWTLCSDCDEVRRRAQEGDA